MVGFVLALTVVLVSLGRGAVVSFLFASAVAGLAQGAAFAGSMRALLARSSIDTQKGPADWFTGDVYIDAVAAPAGTSTYASAAVHFTPGARTAWHTHPHGQTIFVTEGVGLCQREGDEIEEIRPGDRVFFAPGENHWHGAAPNRFMVHIAIQQVDESGSPVTWGEHVTDQQSAPPRPPSSGP